jgi:multidrug efflux system outer membrane protein
MRRAKLRALAAAALVCATLVGCPVGPNYHPPEIPTPETFRSTQVEPAEAASLADLPWWDVFNDPVLQRLVDESIRGNYDLRAAVANVEQSQAQVGVARAPLFPQIGYQGLASRQNQFISPTFGSQTFNLFQGAFNLAWELDIWGRIRRSTEAAQGALLASEEFRRGVLLSLVSSVGQAYFELIELDRELEIAHETSKSFTDTLQLFTRRFEGGVGSKLQVERAAAALAQTNATIPELEREIIAKENQIDVLLGRNPAPIPRGAILIDQTMPPQTPPGLPSDLLERRPDVRQAEANIISANALVGVAIANFLPRLGLTALYGGESTELKNVFKGSGNIWNIAASLTGPIFTGGQNYEQYLAQVAAFEQSRNQWAQTAITAFGEVSDVLTSQQKLVEIRTQEQLQVDALKESVRLSLLRYNQGLANYYEVLEAQQQLYPAELSLARTQAEQLIIVVQLYKALGGGWKLPDDQWNTAAAAPQAGTSN